MILGLPQNAYALDVLAKSLKSDKIKKHETEVSKYQFLLN
jgi:hypothetical protein